MKTAWSDSAGTRDVRIASRASATVALALTETKSGFMSPPAVSAL